VTYVLDDIAGDPLIQAQPQSFRRTYKQKKHYTLTNLFNYRFNNSEKLDEEIKKEFDEDTPPMFRLRRVFQTQTVLHVAPLMREETHRVIRKYRNYKDYFFRITLVSEHLSKIHFGEKM
jgi:hypothetical protein